MTSTDAIFNTLRKVNYFDNLITLFSIEFEDSHKIQWEKSSKAADIINERNHFTLQNKLQMRSRWWNSFHVSQDSQINRIPIEEISRIHSKNVSILSCFDSFVNEVALVLIVLRCKVLEMKENMPIQNRRWWWRRKNDRSIKVKNENQIQKQERVQLRCKAPAAQLFMGDHHDHKLKLSQKSFLIRICVNFFKLFFLMSFYFLFYTSIVSNTILMRTERTPVKKRLKIEKF